MGPGIAINLNPRSDVAARLARALARPHPDRRQWIIRPDDLLVFDIELHDLRVEPGTRGAAARLVKDGPGQALLTIILPPQHVAEIVYFTNTDGEGYPVAPKTDKGPDTGVSTEPPDDPPIWTVTSGWSRLVFVVPDAILPVRWTLTDLLRLIGTLELKVAANALPPSDEPAPYHSSVVDVLRAADLELSKAVAASAPAAAGAELTEAASRLVVAARARRLLRVNAGVLGISELTGSATAKLPAAVAADLATPRVIGALARPSPRPPTSSETALELPYELCLSPNRFAAWAHAAAPVHSSASGHTELWHTRLAVQRGTGGSALEGSHPQRRVRAIWTTAGMALTTPPFGASVATPGAGSAPRMSMDAFDKHNVVHLTSNFQLQDLNRRHRYFEPSPLDVNHLALSSLGAWMDTRGVWDAPPRGLSVEEWRHRATMARDHDVRIVHRGFLFPWGHRASLVKITERRFDATRKGNPAYLFQRMFIVVREPVRTYRNSGLVYEGPETPARRNGERFDLMLPFSSVRVTTLVSPLLDRPDDDIGGNKESCFWPFVGGQPFKFHLVAIDVVGNAVELSMPLIFVRKEHLEAEHATSIVPQSPKTTNHARGLYSTAKRATVPVLGQRLAFAASSAPDDTTFSVETLTFGGEVPLAATYDRLDWRHPRFFPVVRGSDVNVPSLQAIAGTAAPASMVYAGAYLVDEFAAQNGGQVFLGADPATAQFRVGFSTQSQRSGALLLAGPRHQRIVAHRRASCRRHHTGFAGNVRSEILVRADPHGDTLRRAQTVGHSRRRRIPRAGQDAAVQRPAPQSGREAGFESRSPPTAARRRRCRSCCRRDRRSRSAS